MTRCLNVRIWRMGTESRIWEHYGSNTQFYGRLQGLWSDQDLVNTEVSKTVCYGMEEVIGSIPIRSTK